MKRPVTRRAVLGALGAASLAGCTELGAGGGGGTPTGGNTDGSGPPTVTNHLPLPMDPDSVRSEAVSGGPPKDGIPSIDDPKFIPADKATWLNPGDPVFGLATEGSVRAYPQSILVLHEICNDVVDGRPVSVTYCPLTGTAMGFERGETTFGVSGRLVNNNLIMYDRATETWWPQVLATAIPGPWNESPATESLREFRLVWTTWERWSGRHPETEVLSQDTGFAKNYDRDPYGSYNPRRGYYEPDASPMFPSLSDDDRLPPKAVVLGTRTPEGAAAFEKDTLRAQGLVEGELGGERILAVHDPALDTGYVYRNPEGRQFEHRDGQVVDASGTAHRPASLPLERTLSFDAMWFAWSGFYPETNLYASD
jgi:hypothetical protein